MDTAAIPRRRLRAEILIVLGLSLGQSGVYAIVRFIELYTKDRSPGNSTTTLHPSASSINYIDLVIQVLRIGFSLVPVALAIYLLGIGGQRAAARLGLTGPGRAWWKDVGVGAALAAAIGIPGLGLYLVGRAIGQTVRVDVSGLPDQWWTAAILLMAAAAAAVLEEVVVVGYLATRLRELGWAIPAIILASALLRGTYHLYQGWPMALGNVVMGVLFAWVFLRRGRVGPLILAHFLLDFVAFVGPEVVPQSWLAALGLV